MKGGTHTGKPINHSELFLASSNNFLLFLLGGGGAGGGVGGAGMVKVEASTVSLV